MIEHDDDYLIWSHEHSAWCCPDRSGYTERLSEAVHVTRDAAIRICRAMIPVTANRLSALPNLPVKFADVFAMQTAYRLSFVVGKPESWE